MHMRIGLLASNAALVEYFVSALGLSSHTVTLYPSREGLFFAIFTGASLHQRAPYDLLLIELTLDGDGKQVIAELDRFARDLASYDKIDPLHEDILGLLVGNTTPEERRVLAVGHEMGSRTKQHEAADGTRHCQQLRSIFVGNSALFTRNWMKLSSGQLTSTGYINGIAASLL